MDELLDKGVENLSKTEKELLTYLIDGGKIKEEEKAKVIKKGDSLPGGGNKERDFLNKILG